MRCSRSGARRLGRQLLLLAAVVAAHGAAQSQSASPATTQSTSSAALADRWWGEVTYVVDGDSLWIRPEGQRSHKPQRVRLDGVDAPEICQDSGRAAQQALSQRVLHQRVQVDARARDGYGRLIAQVSHQGQDLGQWLARAGWVWSPSFRHAPGPYAEAVAQAQAAHLGLFVDAQPMLPADFRRVHGPCRSPNKL